MYKVEVGDGLKNLINEVIDFKKKNDMDGMLDCMRSMTENPETITSSLPKFDCDEVLIFVDDNVTVYYIATTPKILYPPHEHGMIAISTLYKGAETHVFYDREGENVKERSRVVFQSPAVIDMAVECVHAICNGGDAPNESLHFYLGDLETQKRILWDQNGNNPQQYVEEDYQSFSRPFD